MEVPFTPDQKAFLQDAMAAGRLHGPEDAIREALLLWERRERARARILAAVDEAEASLARGEGRTLTEEDIPGFVEEIHQRGLARHAAKQSSQA
jgi:Arc/MetJ-type ribon-helix-helix transcriptional regulator